MNKQSLCGILFTDRGVGIFIRCEMLHNHVKGVPERWYRARDNAGRASPNSKTCWGFIPILDLTAAYSVFNEYPTCF